MKWFKTKERGIMFCVDDCDIHLVINETWNFYGGYITSTRTREKLHCLIIGTIPEYAVIDHINQNPLDNTRANLRVTTRSVNAYNSKSQLRPDYCVHKTGNKYQVSVWRTGRKKYVGTYETKAEAIVARNAYLQQDPNPS